MGSKTIPDGRRQGEEMNRKSGIKRRAQPEGPGLARLKLNELLGSNALLTALRIIMGIVFVAASCDKLLFPEVFAAKAAEYKLIPELLLPVTAVAIPWVEFICGLLLTLNVFSRSTALILAVTLAGFIFGMAYDLSSGLAHDCGCFSFLEESIGAGAIIRDVFFIALLLPIIIYGENKFPHLSRKGK